MTNLSLEAQANSSQSSDDFDGPSHALKKALLQPEEVGLPSDVVTLDVLDDEAAQQVADFMRQFVSIKSGLDAIHGSSKEIGGLARVFHISIDQRESSRCTQRIQFLMANTTALTRMTKRKIDSVRDQCKDDSEVRKASTARGRAMHTAYLQHARRLQDEVGKYEKVVQEFQLAMLSRTRRELLAAAPTLSDEEVEAVIDSALDPAVVMDALPGGSAAPTRKALADRRSDMVDIDRYALEVQEVADQVYTLTDVRKQPVSEIKRASGRSRLAISVSMTQSEVDAQDARTARRKTMATIACMLGTVAGLVGFLVVVDT